MKKNYLLFLALLFTFQIVLAQTNTIILQPKHNKGKDSFIYDFKSTQNYGEHPEFSSISWTNGGTPVNARGLLEFDLSSIPHGATINSAKLSLYSFDSPSNGSHSTLSGSNESVLNRLTSSWDENTVNWSNQPSFTIQNQVILAESTNEIQNYLDIDVTSLVQDMVDNPNNSFGFLLKLVTEDYYRAMIFASSDNTDSSLHPKLEVRYSLDSSLSVEKFNDITFNVFPNPTINSITVDVKKSHDKLFSIEVINSSGKIVNQIRTNNSKTNIDVSDYPKGLYFVNVYFDESVSTKKIIIE